MVFSRFYVGFGAGSVSVISRNRSEDPDPDAYQNETAPKHWFLGTSTLKAEYSNTTSWLETTSIHTNSITSWQKT